MSQNSHNFDIAISPTEQWIYSLALNGNILIYFGFSRFKICHHTWCTLKNHMYNQNIIHRSFTPLPAIMKRIHFHPCPPSLKWNESKTVTVTKGDSPSASCPFYKTLKSSKTSNTSKLFNYFSKPSFIK